MAAVYVESVGRSFDCATPEMDGDEGGRGRMTVQSIRNRRILF